MNLSTTNETINNSYQDINTNKTINIYSNEFQHIKPQLSKSPGTLNSNPFILPKSDINYKTFSSPKSENLKLKLIEKDKIIFDYMKKEKEYIKSIENLKSSLNEKEDIIIKLKQEIKELEFKFSKKENLLNQKNEECSLKTDEKQSLILNLQKENNDLYNKIINLNKVIKTYEKDKKNNYEENQKNSNKIIELVNQITKNENLLKMMKQSENNLKEENKQIPSLKRKINDFENIIKDYQNKIDELKKNNDKVINDKEELNNIINKKTEEIQKEKINEQYIIRLNHKIDYLSNELNSKNIEYENIKNKYILLQKDLDIFINIFINELNNYLNYLEGLNVFSKTLHKLPVGTIPNFENININNEFRIKYEMFGKVIYQIKEKIIDILNKNIEKNQNLLVDYINKENKYKLLLEEKDNILKNKNELDDNILSTNNQIQKYKIELQKFQKDYNKLKSDLLQMQNLNKDYMLKNKILKRNSNDFIDDLQNQLKDFPYKNKLDDNILNTNNQIQKYKIELQKFQKDYNKLKSDLLQMQNLNKDYILKNKILKRNFNDFVDDIQNQLKDFPYKNKVNKDNLKNKIISQINSLIILNKELNNQIKILEKENKGYKLELNQTIKDNKNLKNELNDNNKDITNKINIIKNKNENEFLNQKKILYDKIHKLNNLLEESNQIIKAYEKETANLKIQNLKLENNLKLLTYSHHELEKIINSSTNGLKTEIDIKDQKYNDLLKELQLKDIHIKSLEKLFENQNKPDIGKIFTKINAIPVNFSDENNNNEDALNTTFNMNKNNDLENNKSELSFSRDDVTEMKLNKLINNFEIRNKINNLNNQNINNIKYEEDIGKNYIDIKDLIKYSDDKNLNENLENNNYILD